MISYNDLNDLITQNADAGRYFNELPGYVREQIGSRGGNVKTFESLRDYAENLLRGDN